MKRPLIILGTRPEGIKLAPLIHELQRRPDFRPLVCSTGQHREMLNQVLVAFEITPDWNLDLMTPGQSLGDLSARLISSLGEVVSEADPGIVVVQGDTTTALMGALVGYYNQLPVAHVEAGLRTGDKYSPFPEEVNRSMIDDIADICFAPTTTARDNLLREGVPHDRVPVVGNTAVDAILWARDRVTDSDGSDAILRSELELIPAAIRNEYSTKSERRLLLVTGHRRESFGPDFEQICKALRAIVEQHPDVDLAFPAHLNPNVQEPVNRILGGTDRIHIFPPPSYLGFVWLMQHCYFVLTDSGGIQEEAPSLDKPVLVMRRKTERPEGVEAGCAKLVGVEYDSILAACNELLNDPALHRQMSEAENPYGDGKTSIAIADALEAYVGRS